MPPKNKKQQEQQAKRLQQQRKKKEQEQARLEIERKKYLGETLSTGLFLPASNQLILDFDNKPIQFVSEKLKQSIKDAYPLVSTAARLEFILKELHYYIKDSLILFGKAEEGANLNKHRIFVGIMISLLLNNDAEAKGTAKNRADDQKKAKQLVTTHCNKHQGIEPFTKKQGIQILNYIKQRYFSRFLLIKQFDKFPKRQTETRTSIYIETPSFYFNQQTTPFTDLSQAEQPKAQ